MENVRRRVLVVEDDPEVRECLVELLELLGHQVRSAATGEEAVAASVAHELDVVFVDLGLPDISGYEVAARMRSAARSRELTIIALSGRSRPEDLARSAASGFDLHLVKPVGSRTIADACDRSRASASSTTCGCSVVTEESTGPLASPPTTFRT